MKTPFISAISRRSIVVLNFVTRAGMDELLAERLILTDEVKDLDITYR